MRLPCVRLTAVEPEQARLAAHLAFAGLEHPQFDTASEMAHHLSAASHLVWIDECPAGYATVVPPVVHEVALHPSRTALAAVVMPQIVRGMQMAFYEDAWRPLFESMGFETVRSMQRWEGVMPPPLQMEVHPGVRGVTEDDIEPLADLMLAAFPDPLTRASARQVMQGLFGSPTHPVSPLSSCVQLQDGRIEAAALYVAVPGSKTATLVHLMSRSGSRPWSVDLGARIRLEAHRLGITRRIAWVEVDDQRMAMLMAVNQMSAVGAPRHQGWRA